MFVIKKSQITAFSNARANDFRSRAMKHLRAARTAELAGIDDAELARRIDKTIETAKHYDLHTEVGVIVFFELALVYGEQFYKTEMWANNILNYFGLDRAEKIKRLKSYV